MPIALLDLTASKRGGRKGRKKPRGSSRKARR